MARLLAPALLLILLLAPATAAAQTPPDERATARAFADIGVRATAAIDAASKATDSASDVPPVCQATRRLRRRGTTRQLEMMSNVFTAHWIARSTGRALPAITQATTELDAVVTADPVLRAGRTAWRHVRRDYTRFAALQPVRFCSQVRDFVRSDFRPTVAMRRALRIYRQAMRWDTTDIDRRLARALKRLIELGVAPADADAFDGEIDG